MRALDLLVVALIAVPAAAAADTVIAARTIRAHAVVTAEDLALSKGTAPGALGEMSAAVGLEARVMIYAGRPVRAADLGPPALVERNEIVVLRYRSGGLVILTEGRAMGRAAAGETIRAVNLASRLSVNGTVAEDGTVTVHGSKP
ncbi:MAG: flagellar basal body P-ring formation chaperone FlgA [Paracoccaceae bacterium]|nr:flagellar basal body P-ring formation chaperone FlgA [Paracoccaceae bacterium]